MPDPTPARPAADEMSDEEIDELVAVEVMGWVKHHRNTAHWMKAGDDLVGYRVQAVVGEWRPSREIAAAWRVVEHLEPRHSLRGFGHNRYLFESGGYVASFWTFESVAARTAPRAICLAALQSLTRSPQ
jgi:hypothetical protein